MPPKRKAAVIPRRSARNTQSAGGIMPPARGKPPVRRRRTVPALASVPVESPAVGFQCQSRLWSQ
jgi:hypothetical protein